MIGRLDSNKNENKDSNKHSESSCSQLKDLTGNSNLSCSILKTNEKEIGDSLNQTLQVGVYRHYKNKKFYQVLHSACHTESREHFVVYRELYGEYNVWVRPLNMFLEQVHLENQMSVPRFEYVGKSINDLNDSSGIAKDENIVSNSATNFIENTLEIVQTNIDDMSSELIGYCIDKLLEMGAKDAWVQPIVMKKSRPAVQLNALIELKDRTKVLSFIFRETTTIGVRVLPISRFSLPREIKSLSTIYGEINVKQSMIGSEIVNVKPEFEDCKILAEKYNVPVKKVIEETIFQWGKSGEKLV
jgi:hypothetical protein